MHNAREHAQGGKIKKNTTKNPSTHTNKTNAAAGARTHLPPGATLSEELHHSHARRGKECFFFTVTAERDKKKYRGPSCFDPAPVASHRPLACTFPSPPPRAPSIAASSEGNRSRRSCSRTRGAAVACTSCPNFAPPPPPRHRRRTPPAGGRTQGAFHGRSPAPVMDRFEEVDGFRTIHGKKVQRRTS